MIKDRVLGLDIGTKRVGVSVSDPLGITAQPVNTLNRRPEEKFFLELESVIKRYEAKLVVAGLPKNMDGSLGFQAEDVTKLVEKIKDKFKIDVIFEDERLTSKDAERILIEQSKKPSKNKHLIDVTAAVLILQQYLDKRR